MATATSCPPAGAVARRRGCGGARAPRARLASPFPPPATSAARSAVAPTAADEAHLAESRGGGRAGGVQDADELARWRARRARAVPTRTS